MITFKIKAFILFLVLFLMGIYLSTDPLYTSAALKVLGHPSHFPKYIAHKALISGNFTGNTLEAIQEAMASNVSGIEIDVRLSKDNVLFLYHGNILEEETNGTGKPEDKTWAELQNVSYRNKEQSRLVSLEQLVKHVDGRKLLILDIKTSALLNATFIKKIIHIIQKNHLNETVVVESFNPLFLIEMRLKARDILLMYAFTVNAKAIGEEMQSHFDQIPWVLKQPFFQKQMRRLIRPDLLAPRWNFDQESLKAFVKLGYPLICWTVDDEKEVSRLFSLGVLGVQTNQSIKMMQANL